MMTNDRTNGMLAQIAAQSSEQAGIVHDARRDQPEDIDRAAHGEIDRLKGARHLLLEDVDQVAGRAQSFVDRPRALVEDPASRAAGHDEQRGRDGYRRRVPLQEILTAAVGDQNGMKQSGDVPGDALWRRVLR